MVHDRYLYSLKIFLTSLAHNGIYFECQNYMITFICYVQELFHLYLQRSEDEVAESVMVANDGHDTSR